MRLLLLVLIATLGTTAFAEAPTTVILVRHAEKEATGGRDPELTKEGRARADALAALLAEVEISAVYSTPFKRTRDTAAPVASARGLDVTVTDVGPDFVKKLAERILANDRGRTVLVVGHSNTLGPTIEALGVGPSFEIDESVYGDIFVCFIPDDGEATLLRLKF